MKPETQEQPNSNTRSGYAHFLKLTGLVLLWIVMPFTAFSKMQIYLSKKDKKVKPRKNSKAEV